jgi:hypothetical protein
VNRIYGEKLLVVWNPDEAVNGLQLDPTRWNWVPEGSAQKIADLREQVQARRGQESVPLRFYGPRRQS